MGIVSSELAEVAERAGREVRSGALERAARVLYEETPVLSGTLVKGWQVDAGGRRTASPETGIPPSVVADAVRGAAMSEPVRLVNEVPYAEEVYVDRPEHADIIPKAVMAAEGAENAIF